MQKELSEWVPIAVLRPFNPNAYCSIFRKPNGKWGNGNCLDCSFQKGQCAPCNACPRREGFWTPSKVRGEEDKLVEVKCHEPCYLFKRWATNIDEENGRLEREDQIKRGILKQ